MVDSMSEPERTDGSIAAALEFPRVNAMTGTKLQEALEGLGRAIRSNPRESDKPAPKSINKRPAIADTSLTIDYGPQLVGDILKQAGQGTTSDLFPNLPQVQPAAKALKPLSRVQSRVLEPLPDHGLEICFQHTVLCQTSMPYRDPGDDVREWQRTQGGAMLVIQAGQVLQPQTATVVDVGLPWGPKPRLILAHLNAEALRLDSAEIEIDDSLSAFVRRIRGFDGGREIRMFKEQLARLSSALIRLAILRGNHLSQINTHVVTGFDLWFPKDERQRVLWPSKIRLSNEYFESLKKHAVPLNEADLAALAHTAMGLDIYAWLAHRLHRIDPRKPAFIPWAALKTQFGPDYDRIRDFKGRFRVALRQVLSRYQTARIELDDRGMTARTSPPPVGKRLFSLLKLPV
jgi:hypothetical protein